MSPHLSGAELGSQIVLQVREFVARSLGTFGERLTQLSARLEALEQREPLAGQAGKDGRDGVDGKDGKDGIDGKDAEPVHPDTIRALVLEAVQQAVAQLPPAQAGRDAAAIEPLHAIDEARSYPRGTYAEHRGGLIRAVRTTDPVTAGLEAAGWAVCMNGVAEESEALLEDGRTLKRVSVYTNGQRFERSFKLQMMLDRGVWRQGMYEAGDVVSYGGSSWIAQRDTEGKPEQSPDWRLAVKRGRDGKDK